ncbi:class I SAM-dependent methyltransferase [Candidatus Woesearchaeota archaeon]|nr:class I SAM-dependent methyltransferase [Candidatus Woesearchaeota archaeon]
MNKSLLEKLSNDALVDRAIQIGDRTGYMASFFTGGLFSLEQLHNLFEEIKISGQAHEKSKFLELGSGNGVVAILAASAGFESYGIDINKDLVGLSGEFLEQLKREGAVPDGLLCRFVAGDYSAERRAAYDELGIKFSEIDVFYAFNTFEELKKIYEMFEKHSKNSARLIHPGIGVLDFIRSNFENLEATETGNFTVINKKG